MVRGSILDFPIVWIRFYRFFENETGTVVIVTQDTQSEWTNSIGHAKSRREIGDFIEHVERPTFLARMFLNRLLKSKKLTLLHVLNISKPDAIADGFIKTKREKF